MRQIRRTGTGEGLRLWVSGIRIAIATVDCSHESCCTRVPQSSSLITVLVGSGVSSATRQRTSLTTRPPQELFVQLTGLKVSLRLSDRALHVGQDRRFTLRLKFATQHWTELVGRGR